MIAIGAPSAHAVFPGGSGKIAFSKIGFGGEYDVWTMNPDGTDVANVTKSYGFSERGPVWSPDRSGIAFSRSSLIYVMNANGSEARRVPSQCYQPKDPAWSPDGSEIAVACDNGGYDDIYLLSLDGSAPVQITSDTIGYFDDRHPAWSPDGGQIAWAKGDEDVWRMNADGTGKVSVVDAPSTAHTSSVSWSPDGARIAFASTWDCSGCGVSDLFTVQTDGSGLAQFDDPPGYVGKVTWSPDGNRLLFDSCTEEPPAYDCLWGTLWTLAADGTDLQAVPGAGDDGGQEPDWQVAGAPYADPPPASEQIAFVSSRDHAGAGNEIYTMNRDGSRQRRLTFNGWDDTFPAWSPNGTRIAYSSDPDPGSLNQYEIHVMSSDGSGDVALTENPADTNDQRPTWSPDGTKIAFSRINAGTPRRVMVMNADGSGLHEISGNGSDPDWSPDGEWIAFVGDDGNISKMRPDGSDVTVLATGFVQAPNWSPDGHHIAFDRASRIGEVANVWHMDANGDFETQYTFHSESAVYPTWSPDGRAIAYSRLGDVWRAGGGIANLTNHPATDGHPDWQSIISYIRPRIADDVRFPLVPAYQPCASPNRTHGPPLANSSCAPPVAASTYLTVASPDVNGAPATFDGYLRITSLNGNPAVPPDEADVGIELATRDVRCDGASPPSTCGAANSSTTGYSFPDYTGELDVVVFLRITDKLSQSALTQPGPATVQDFDLHITVPCTGTPSTALGSHCTTATTVEALLPGAITEGKRSVWQLDRVHVRDGGADGDADTSGNRVFLRPGVFVP